MFSGYTFTRLSNASSDTSNLFKWQVLKLFQFLKHSKSQLFTFSGHFCLSVYMLKVALFFSVPHQCINCIWMISALFGFNSTSAINKTNKLTSDSSPFWHGCCKHIYFPQKLWAFLVWSFLLTPLLSPFTYSQTSITPPSLLHWLHHHLLNSRADTDVAVLSVTADLSPNPCEGSKTFSGADRPSYDTHYTPWLADQKGPLSPLNQVTCQVHLSFLWH